MKRKLSALLLVLFCLLALTGCCFHSEWYPANCTTPMTCVKCGETEGEALGHTWVDATCTAPRTCSVCQLTEGEPLDHTWVDATCTAPRTCSSCQLTEGLPLDHTWTEATTEAPKTCTVCATTEGERIITDPRFTTASTKGLYGRWVSEIELSGDLFGWDGFEDSLLIRFTMEVYNDGTMHCVTQPTNAEEFEAALVQYTIASTYAQYSGTYTQDEVDAMVLEEMGVPTTEYVQNIVDELDLPSRFTNDLKLVYYVDNNLRISDSWESEFTTSAYKLEGNTLTIYEEPFTGFKLAQLNFTRDSAQ